MVQPTLRRAVAATAAAVALSLGVAGVASAHIDPDPTSVQGGSTATVGFTVEHGCDGSPTVKLEIQAPDDATDPKGIDVAGFTASTAGQVVTFSGGPLGADTEQMFQVTFGAPAAGGELTFPIVQTCEQGSISWIELEQPGGGEPEHPAPVVTVEPAKDQPATTAAASTSEPATTAATTEAAVTTTLASGSAAEGSGTEGSGTDGDSDDDGTNPLIFGGLGLFAILLIGGVVYGYRMSMKKGEEAAGAEAAASIDEPGDGPADPA